MLRLPAVATPTSVSRGLALSFTCGAVLTALSLAVPGGPSSYRTVIWLLVAGALALALTLVLNAKHLTRWVYHLLVLCSWAMVTFGITRVLGQPIVFAYACLYSLITINVILGCSWVAASAHLTLNVFTVLVVLNQQPGSTPAAAAVYAGALVAIAVFVGRLVRAAAETEVDALTGLFNRRGLDRYLQEAMARCERSGAPLAVAVIDLDHFKSVNDRLGHAAGDDLLQAVAGAWRQVLPACVVLARAGGDEFVVAAEAEVELMSEWMQHCAAVMPPGASRSVGIAGRGPGQGPSAVLGRADQALYAAKRHRRGSVRLAVDAETDASVAPPAIPAPLAT